MAVPSTILNESDRSHWLKSTIIRDMHFREMPPDERPREKLLGRGAAALTDPELLAILLRTGVP